MKQVLGGVMLTLLVVALFTAGAMAMGPGTTDLVSVSTSGTSGNGASNYASISGDGRYVAFHSDASNLVPGDTNWRTDVFVRDLGTGVTEMVSRGLDAAPANGYSYWPSISADGRHVAFQSYASNLVAGDTNGRADIFVRDRVAGTTERVSAPGGGQTDGNSSYPSISADGRHVAFVSLASNLVGNDANETYDVFVYDRQSQSIERVSLSSAGVEGNGASDRTVISADGRYVAFQSAASNLVQGDTNWAADIFLRDRIAGTTERVSVPSSGQANGRSDSPSLSADGRYVAFQSYASNLVGNDTNNVYDVFVYDRQSHSTERVSVSGSGVQGNGPSERPTISADGRFVGFYSAATNLVPGDNNGRLDVFLRDRIGGATERASVSSGSAEGNADSFYPALSSDGAHLAFVSLASNLASGDSGWGYDVFVRHRAILDTMLPTTASALSGTMGNNGWYTSDVRVTLAATDNAGGSGVKEIHYSVGSAPEVVVAGVSASFVLSTEGTHGVSFYAKDNAGNVEAARTISVRIDKTAPGIAIVSPTGTVYLLGQVVQANYNVVDGVSGVASYGGTVPSGSIVDTATPGTRQFAVSATDNAGNSAGQTVTYRVSYGVRILSDDTRTAKDGSTIPIKLQLVDASGANKSSAGVVVTALAVSPGGAVNDSGKANPDNNFRYDSTLGGTGGYLYNLSTRGVTTGSYNLVFAVAGDPMTHGVPFDVK